MTQSNIESRNNIWSQIIESPGATESKWFDDYTNSQTILPLVKRVFAKTLANNLVPVTPLGNMRKEEIDKIKSEVISENRDRKIKSILEGDEFTEMKVEDHPDFIKPISSNLFYMDYTYKPRKKTRRAGKKHKK